MFDRSRNLVNHLITFGSFGFGNSRRETPKYIIKRFYKDFEEPSLDEGFTAVIKIPFQKKKFASKEEEEAFHYYLSAKRKFYV